jgi:UDPglucose 6-dehydrogenase
MIGIVGYGFVGKAVEYGFNRTECLIVDPKYTSTTIGDLCSINTEAIFVCVPTPNSDDNYSILTGVLDEIFSHDYKGMIVVKSTILPDYIINRDVIYNPEFLSRNTALEDFVNPHLLIIGGNRSDELLDLYKTKSKVKPKNTFITDIKTASLVKYALNSFFATKITFMNQIYDVSEKMNVDYDELKNILSKHPWMGNYHLEVPGNDGSRGFGGPCLPKDTEAFTKHFNIDILDVVLELNKKYRE